MKWMERAQHLILNFGVVGSILGGNLPWDGPYFSPILVKSLDQKTIRHQTPEFRYNARIRCWSKHRDGPFFFLTHQSFIINALGNSLVEKAIKIVSIRLWYPLLDAWCHSTNKHTVARRSQRTRISLVYNSMGILNGEEKRNDRLRLHFSSSRDHEPSLDKGAVESQFLPE